jgi:hypothetical protein
MTTNIVSYELRNAHLQLTTSNDQSVVKEKRRKR